MMDSISHKYYRAIIESKFWKLRRTEFQSWFSDIMEKAFPGDFKRIRVSIGDRGCDGYKSSTKTVYQVYAPRKMTSSKLKNKIISDFEQARQEFSGKMSEWIFVHNDPDGLPSEIGVDLLEELKTSNPDVKIITYSLEQIWGIVENLNLNDLVILFGSAPTNAALNDLQIKDIIPVIKFIEGREVPVDVLIDAPDPEKLEFNTFSPAVQELLKSGRRKEILVRYYFNSVRDPNYGESLAESFREKYNLLKNSNLNSNEIFDELRKFAGGERFHGSKEHAAIIAVLSFFFESCDIFENPIES